MAHCVSLNNKELISMSEQLDIDVNQLALNIQLYQDKNDTYDFPTIEYLKESLGISGLSKTEYSSKEKYETSLKLWEELYKNTINFKDSKLASEMYLKTLKIFNKDDVFLNKKLDNSYDLIVLKPQEKQDVVKNEENLLSESDNIINNVKEGVSELFESNPELANNVYEALGFKVRSVNFKVHTSKTLNTFLEPFFNSDDESIVEPFAKNLTNEDKKILAKSVGRNYKDINQFDWYEALWSDVGHEEVFYYLKTANSLEQDVQKEKRNSKLYKEWQSFVKENKEFVDGYPKLPEKVQKEQQKDFNKLRAKDEWYQFELGNLEYDIRKKLLKDEGYIENNINLNTQISPEQKQQAQQLYSQYLEQNPNGNIEGFKEFVNDTKENKQKQDVYEKDIFGDINEEKEDFYNNDILTSSDRGYLARQAVVQLSELVDSLQKGTFELTPQEVKEEYFNNEFEDVDFSTMERFDIIKRITLIKLLDVVKERKFNPIISEYILGHKEEQQLQLAYDNFYTLVKLAYHKLLDSEQLSLSNKQLTDLEDIENIENIEDIIDGIIDGLSEKESWQRGIKHISVKDSLSPEIKRELSKIKELDEEGKPIIDKYGMNKIIDPDIIYNTILKTVSSFLNIEDMENALKTNSSINPWMSEVIKLIKNEPFRSKFFQNFRKDNIQYSIIIREKKKDGYVYKIKKLNSSEYSEQLSDALTDLIDENNLNVVIDSEIKDETIISKLNKKLIAKNITIINDLFNSVKSKINNISESEYLSFVKDNLNTINDLLNDVGIIIPIETLNKFLENNISQNNKFTRTNASSLLGKLNLLLKELNKEELDNIEFVKHTTGFYKTIANLFTAYVIESSDTAVYQSGKLYQSYVTPSSLGKLIINLRNKNNKQDTQKVLDYIKKEFLQFDWFYNEKKNHIFPSWLRLLSLNNQRGDNARNVLEHKVQLEFNGVNYVDLSPLEYLTALLQEYTLAPKGTAWFHAPIFSDKPSAEFIKFYKYDKTGDVTKELSNLFFQELNRIKTVLDRANKNDIEYITNYDIVLSQELKEKKKSGKLITFDDILKLESSKRGGSEFKFLDFFNNPLNERIKEGIIENINSENTENLILNEIIEEIDKNLNEKFESTIKVWEKLGLFEIDKNTKKYKHIPNYGNDTTEVYNNLKKYYYNSYLATANIIQLTVTDIAFYKNVEDFQKRFAQLHSPALRLNVNAVDSNGVKYSKDGVEKTIYLKDNEVMSLFKKEILTIFDDKIKKAKLQNEKLGLTKLRDEISKKLDEINSTDAQAFNSLTGLRKKLGMSGKWDNASQKAYDSIKSGNWTLEDTHVLWQPLKPFVYTLLNKSGYSKYTRNIKVPVQNKNSEYLLFIASVIANDNSPKLKAIFDFMEENDIDTVQFESAVKSGKQGVININDINGYDNIKNYLENKIFVKSENGNKMYNEQVVHQIPFEDYGIQQNVPSHIIDTTQGVGSQIRKLIISDISNDATFNINGREYTKLELIDLYSNLIKANVDESLNELYKELGFDENGEIVDKKEQNKMLSSLLIEEARKNGRYGPDTIRSFELNKDGDFVVPLNDLTNSYRIQQLLNSIIKSRITKQVSNGGSAVQLSSYGLNKDLKIVFNEDGSIKYFEAYITVFSEKLKELLLDYDVNGNPYYNIDKKVNGKFVFPEEARKILGYRIPTEDKYSMTPIYIKGFLPEQSGGAIMLPHEITLLSGSDKKSMFDPL